MSSSHTLFVLAIVAVVGCESPQEKNKDAEEARQAADQRVAQVTRTTEQKEIEVRQKADQDMAGVAIEGEKKIVAAKMGADRKADEATEALWHAREQARADSSRKLDGLDQDVAAVRLELVKKLSTAAATSVGDGLSARAAAIRKRILDLDQCSIDDLEPIKRSIHTGFDDLEQALADAKKLV